jgi:hypothetical protein
MAVPYIYILDELVDRAWQLASVPQTQLVGLYQNRRATGSSESRLHCLSCSLGVSEVQCSWLGLLKCIYKFPLDNFHQQHQSLVNHSANHLWLSNIQNMYLKVMMQYMDRGLCLEILLPIYLGQFMLEMMSLSSLFLLNPIRASALPFGFRV